MTRRFLLFVLVSLLLSGLAVAQETAGDLLERADAAFAAESYPEAVDLYRQLTGVKPEMVHAWSRLGLLESWENRLPEALAAYRKALELAPGDPDLRLELARVYSWKGDFEPAVAEYRGVLADRPGNRKALFGLARSLSWANRFDEAIATYRLVLEAAPSDQEARLEIARVQSWDNRFDEALATYQEVLATDPANVEARLGVARVLSWSDDLAQAVERYEQILKDNPESAAAHMGLGNVRHWQGMDRDAFSHLERARELDPRNDEAVRALRRLSLDHAPALEPRFLTSRDSDGNQLENLGAAISFDLEPQTRVGLSYLNQRSSNANQQLAGRAEQVSGKIYSRLAPELGLGASVGTVLLNPDRGPSSTETIGGVALDLTPDPNDALSLAYNHEILTETAQLIQNHVSYDTYAVAYHRRLPEATGLRLGYSHSDFSDDNARDAYFASFYHDIRRFHPNIKVGLTYRYLRYDLRTFSGYFNPPKFRTSELFFSVDNHDLDDPWLYSLQAAAGYQKIDTEASQFIHRLSASLGYRITDSVEFELGGVTSNSAISSVPGFSYSAGTASFKVRF